MERQQKLRKVQERNWPSKHNNDFDDGGAGQTAKTKFMARKSGWWKGNKYRMGTMRGDPPIQLVFLQYIQLKSTLYIVVNKKLNRREG